jgi:tetratricopeptide (TPR) repeat protein
MLAFILTLFLLIPPMNPDEAFRPEVGVEFPNLLFREGNYLGALIEYKRYLYYNPDDPRRPYLEYRMGICYLRMGAYDRAEGLLRSVALKAKDDRLRDEAELAWAKALFGDDKYDPAKLLTRRMASRTAYPDLAAKALLLNGWCFLNEMNWAEATIRFRQIVKLYPDNPISKEASALADEALSALFLPRKSPRLARIFSTVIPGLGLVYAGEKLRGLGYMIGNIALLSLAVRSALRGEHLDLVLLGSAWIWTYLRNVRSSYGAALKHNSRIEGRYLNSLKLRYQIDPRPLID